MHPVKQTLIAARAKIALPEHWTRGALARHANGNAIGPQSENACKFCSVGAIAAITEDDELIDVCLGVLSSQIPGRDTGVVTYNDTTGCTHAEILKMFDGAIENANAD